MVTCQSMLSMAKKANFFDSILTGDEKWIAFDNTHRGLQWSNAIRNDGFDETDEIHQNKIKKVIVKILTKGFF